MKLYHVTPQKIVVLTFLDSTPLHRKRFDEFYINILNEELKEYVTVFNNVIFQHPVALVFNYMHVQLPSQVQPYLTF
jgi:hypothetical protein